MAHAILARHGGAPNWQRLMGAFAVVFLVVSVCVAGARHSVEKFESTNVALSLNGFFSVAVVITVTMAGLFMIDAFLTRHRPHANVLLFSVALVTLLEGIGWFLWAFEHWVFAAVLFASATIYGAYILMRMNLYFYKHAHYAVDDVDCLPGHRVPKCRDRLSTIGLLGVHTGWAFGLTVLSGAAAGATYNIYDSADKVADLLIIATIVMIGLSLHLVEYTTALGYLFVLLSTHIGALSLGVVQIAAICFTISIVLFCWEKHFSPHVKQHFHRGE